MKKFVACILSLSLAGSVLFCGFTGRVRKGVWIDDSEVGGMAFSDAETLLRSKQERLPFVLDSPNGAVEAELTYRDDLELLLRKAKRGESLASTLVREWADAELVVEDLCKSNAVEPKNATVTFTSQGEFVYAREQTGVACLYRATLEGALRALKDGQTHASLITKPVAAELTEDMLRARTQRLSSFSTVFDETKTARTHNIGVACTRITGTVLEPNEEFSFNERVGKRTKENGFEEATVIFDGEFVQGLGGGVCQASTTLMNAALLAGLTVTESRNHSLSVTYVPPSLDAMVSEYSDLKFVNPYPFPVYLRGRVTRNRVVFEVFGMPSGLRYRTESVVLARIAPPEEQIVEGEEDAVVRPAREGILSESYLLVYDGNTLVSRTRLRKDAYAVVQGIRKVKPTDESPAPAGESEQSPE